MPGARCIAWCFATLSVAKAHNVLASPWHCCQQTEEPKTRLRLLWVSPPVKEFWAVITHQPGRKKNGMTVLLTMDCGEVLVKSHTHPGSLPRPTRSEYPMTSHDPMMIPWGTHLSTQKTACGSNSSPTRAAVAVSRASSGCSSQRRRASAQAVLAVSRASNSAMPGWNEAPVFWDEPLHVHRRGRDGDGDI